MFFFKVNTLHFLTTVTCDRLYIHPSQGLIRDLCGIGKHYGLGRLVCEGALGKILFEAAVMQFCGKELQGKLIELGHLDKGGVGLTVESPVSSEREWNGVDEKDLCFEVSCYREVCIPGGVGPGQGILFGCISRLLVIAAGGLENCSCEIKKSEILHAAKIRILRGRRYGSSFTIPSLSP